MMKISTFSKLLLLFILVVSMTINPVLGYLITDGSQADADKVLDVIEKYHDYSIAKDVDSYVTHRLRIAGSNKSPFSDEALEAIYTCTQGVPRDINNLCDRSLLAGYLENIKKVDKAVVDEAWEDLH